MGRTVPAYRLAAVRERRRWTVLWARLDKSERKLFDEMMSYPQLYSAAGIGACTPDLIQPMLMSIEHYKQLLKTFRISNSLTTIRNTLLIIVRFKLDSVGFGQCM